MPDTAYCYHCGVHHPLAEMRQVPTKAGPRWRCIRSIKGAQKSRAERAAFGRQTTAINMADAQAVRKRMVNPERER